MATHEHFLAHLRLSTNFQMQLREKLQNLEDETRPEVVEWIDSAVKRVALKLKRARTFLFAYYKKDDAGMEHPTVRECMEDDARETIEYIQNTLNEELIEFGLPAFEW